MTKKNHIYARELSLLWWGGREGVGVLVASVHSREADLVGLKSL